MKRNLFVLLAVFLLATGFIYPEKVADMPDVMKPTALSVDKDQLYVQEGTTIHIYSLKDYKKIATFGREGEGPQEFKSFATVSPHQDYLLINSMGKLSYFSRDGKFQKELRTGPGIFNGAFQPLEKGFAGTGVVVEDKIVYLAVFLYNSKLEKQKELFRTKSAQQQSGKIKLMTGEIAYDTYENKVFITGKEEFKIDVTDHTGKNLYTIKNDYQRVKLTSKDVDDIKEVLKRQFKAEYERVKSRIEYPDYFPAIINFKIGKGVIYILTWKRDKGNYEMFILDIKGKLLKKATVPFFMQNPIVPYSFTINNGNLYQLTENEDEEWELHITKIK